MATVTYPADKGTRIIGIMGVLTGVFVIIVIVGDLSVTHPSPITSSQFAQALANFNANQNLYAFGFAVEALAYTFLIAFAGGFSRIVRQKSPSVSTSAAFLVAAGGLTLLIVASLTVAPLFAISSAPQTAANSSEAAYLASIVAGLEFDWIWVGFLLLGVGTVLFGWLIWEGGTFPRWLSRVVLVIGILYFVPPISNILPSTFALLAPIALVGADVLGLVWFFEAGIVLLRSKSTMA